MAVTETGVSYYGISYPEHARADFAEMRAPDPQAAWDALGKAYGEVLTR